MKFQHSVIFVVILFSCQNDVKSNREASDLTSLEHLKTAKEYSDMAVRVMNLSEEGIVEQNKIESFKELIKKSLKEANQVDLNVLNKIHQDFGEIYKAKYIGGLELQLSSFNEGSAKEMVRGQILYDEYVDWVSKNLDL